MAKALGPTLSSLSSSPRRKTPKIMEGERDGCESKNTMERPSFQSVLSVNSSNIPPGLSLGGDQFIDDKKKKKSGFQNLPSDSIL